MHRVWRPWEEPTALLLKLCFLSKPITSIPAIKLSTDSLIFPKSNYSFPISPTKKETTSLSYPPVTELHNLYWVPIDFHHMSARHSKTPIIPYTRPTYLLHVVARHSRTLLLPASNTWLSVLQTS